MVVVDGSMHANFNMKHLYFMFWCYYAILHFSVSWPNISILCAMVDHERFFVFRVDHWYQMSGHLCVIQCYVYHNLIRNLYIWRQRNFPLPTPWRYMRECILSHNSRWMWVDSCMPQTLCTLKKRAPQYPLRSRMGGSESGLSIFEEEKNLSPLPQMKLWFIHHLTHSLVTVPAVLCTDHPYFQLD